VLAVLCGIASAVIVIMMPIRAARWERAAIAATLAAGVTMLVLGVAGMSGDLPPSGPTFVPGAGVHTIGPPGPSGGVR
jgi:hypothetical protein